MVTLGKSRVRALGLLVLLGASGTLPRVPVRADDLRPKVVLTLDGATAERWGHGDILFECRLSLENQTGAELKVRSNFFSAFDGMSLVVLDEGDKELKRQPYTYHQSPHSFLEGREFVLPTGKSAARLVFPVPGLPREATTFRVQVAGTLPGSGYEPGLATRVRAVRVKAKGR